MSIRIEGNPSTEQMPHLEPLSEVHLLHGSPPELVAPHQVGDHRDRNDVGGLVRDAMAPLRLSLVLENKGNVARDHLASERTYLAYVRTSLACTSAGVALVQLFMLSGTTTTGVDLTKFAKPLGATIILFGLVILVVGVIRYFSTQSALVRGHFPVARYSIMMIAFVLGTLVSIVFGITVAGTKR